MSGQREYYTSGGYAAAGTILPDGGTLLQVTGFNPTGNQSFILFFDDASPTVGQVPQQAILVAAGANFSWCPTPPGYPFGTALAWAISSTGNELTASADEYWVYAESVGQ